jgi:hypothetical protein
MRNASVGASSSGVWMGQGYAGVSRRAVPRP